MGSQDRPYMEPRQRRGSCSTTAGCGCKGKDLGPLEDHEEPSEDDVERFGSVTRTCSRCETEVYDEAEICHNCGHHLNQAEDGRSLPTWAVAATVAVIVVLCLAIIWI